MKKKIKVTNKTKNKKKEKTPILKTKKERRVSRKKLFISIGSLVMAGSVVASVSMGIVLAQEGNK